MTTVNLKTRADIILAKAGEVGIISVINIKRAEHHNGNKFILEENDAVIFSGKMLERLRFKSEVTFKSKQAVEAIGRALKKGRVLKEFEINNKENDLLTDNFLFWSIANPRVPLKFLTFGNEVNSQVKKKMLRCFRYGSLLSLHIESLGNALIPDFPLSLQNIFMTQHYFKLSKEECISLSRLLNEREIRISISAIRVVSKIWNIETRRFFSSILQSKINFDKIFLHKAGTLNEFVDSLILNKF